MARYTYTVMAQSYGQGVYNDCDYNCATGAGTATGGGSTSPLAGTGIMVVGIVTLACLIIFITLIVRVMGRRRRKQTSVAPSTYQDAAQSDPPVDR
jgi:uncharacterized membrane protein